MTPRAKHCSIKYDCNQYSLLAISANFAKKDFFKAYFIYMYRLYGCSKGCIDTINISITDRYIAASINRCSAMWYCSGVDNIDNTSNTNCMGGDDNQYTCPNGKYAFQVSENTPLQIHALVTHTYSQTNTLTNT